MTQETCEALVAAADELGIDCSHRPDYSGRGMYGKSTHAVVMDMSDLAVCAALAGHKMEDVSALIEDLQGCRTDSMGKSDTVIY